MELLDSDKAGQTAIRGGALRVTGYVGGLLLGLISVPLLIRHLGVGDFGRYVTVLSLYTIVVAMTEGGLIGIALREYVNVAGDARTRLMRNLLGMRLGLSLLAVLIAIAFALVAGYDRVLVLGTLLAAPGVVAQALQAFMSVSAQAELRFGALTAQDLVGHAGIVLAIVILVLLDASLLPFLAISLPVGLVSLGVTTWLARGRMPKRPAFDRATWVRLFAESLPYAAAVAVGAIYFRVTILIMSLISSELETGYFAMSFRVVEVLILVPVVLITAIFPIVARAASSDADRFRYAMSRALDVALVAGAWLVLAMALGAGFVIDVIAGSEGEPAVEVLRIQCLALLATFVAQTCSFGLLSLKRYRGMLVAASTALGVNVVLTLILAEQDGARGAAIATVGTELALALVLLVVLRRADPRLPLPLATAGKVALAALAGALCFLLPVPDVVRAVIGSLVYFGVLAAVRGIPRELLDAGRLGLTRR